MSKVDEMFKELGYLNSIDRMLSTSKENSISKQAIEELIEKNAFEVYTKDYGNIGVIDIQSLQELLEEKYV